MPTTGIAACCAPAASGHVTAAPPTMMMNSRRLMGLTPRPNSRSCSGSVARIAIKSSAPGARWVTAGAYVLTQPLAWHDHALAIPSGLDAQSAPCSGIHNRVHRPLHCLIVDRIDVGQLVRDRLQEL